MIKMSVLLLAFGSGLLIGIAITFLTAIFATGSQVSKHEERMWREAEAEMDEMERREVRKP